MKQNGAPDSALTVNTETANPGEHLDIFTTDSHGNFIKFDAQGEINLAKTSTGDVRNTRISPWTLSFAELEKILATPIVGEKNGPYFVRASGENRTDFDLAEYSGLLILDGDSRIGDDGEILDGCVRMQDAHSFLAYLAVPHIICPSHSCFSSLEKLNNKDEALRSAGKTPKNRGGVSGYSFYKWHLLIPCRYEKHQLKYLVNFFIKILNENDLSVADVPENCRWSQPWFLPRVDKELELDFSLHTYSLLEGYSLSASKIIELVTTESHVNLHNHHQKEQDLLPGFVSPITAFNSANHVRQVLEANGYTETDANRYLRPGSTSGQAGLSILKDEVTGVEYAYSFGGDVLNDGKRHDAFDVFRLLQHDGDLKAALAWNHEITAHNQQLKVTPSAEFEVVQFFDSPKLAACDVRDGTQITRPLTELGNALRFVDKFGEDIRFIPETNNRWLFWQDGWTYCTDTKATAFMQTLVPDIYKEGSQFLVESEYFAKWARTSQKRNTIENSLKLLKSLDSISVPLSHVDADIDLIGFNHATWVVDLKTGEPRPVQKTDFVTKSLNVGTVGDAQRAVRWLKFLTEIFEGDQELIDWIQRYCGYLLTGSVKEQILFFGFGLGANGKTVFAELLKYIMGDYSRTITPETISETRRTAGGASPDIANLAGARLVVGSETEEGQALNESLVKQLTGGEKIVARNLYESQFEFTPQFKLMILGNHKPFIRGNDYGIWRRILLVPFLKTFDKNERDPDLLDTLKSEAPDILAWMIRGHQLWNEEGLSKIPDAIVNASSEYRQEVDYLGQWLQECCLVEDGAETAKTVAYNSYRCWAVECGLKPLTSQSFGRRMKEKGISESRTSAARVWIGVKINTSGLFSEINQEEGLN